MSTLDNSIIGRMSLNMKSLVLIVTFHLVVGVIQPDELLDTNVNSFDEEVPLLNENSRFDLDEMLDLKEGDSPESDVSVTRTLEDLKPLVQVVLLARNKAFMLPTFLAHFEALRYPKDRMILYVRADHSRDQTIDILQDWLSDVQDLYNATDVILDRTSRRYPGEEEPCIYTTPSYEGVIHLKETALQDAHRREVDFVVFLDVDVIITNENIFDHFVNNNYIISAPLLHSVDGDKYGNFWPTYLDDVWFEEYEEEFWGEQIHNRAYFYYMNVRSCLHAFLVHSCVFLDLRREGTEKLTFDSDKLHELDHVPRDDLVTFALSAELNNITSYICNTKYYGAVMPPTYGQSDFELEKDLQDLKMVALKHANLLPPPISLSKYSNKKKQNKPDKLGFDEIFYINLERRPERKLKMEQQFAILGLDATRVEAVDGRKLTDEMIQESGIRQLDGYRNPYDGNNMTKGEFGCFLSHYKLWNEIVARNYSQVLILEDDASFLEGFRTKMLHLQQELNRLVFQYDLVYITRVEMFKEIERPVPGSSVLVHADYSHWTLGYILTRSGALKLLNQDNLLSKLLPLDLYICAKANSLPADWKFHYSPRNLVTLSLSETAVQPTSIQDTDEDFLSDTSYITGSEPIEDTPATSLVVDPLMTPATKLAADQRNTSATPGSEATLRTPATTS